MTTNLGPPQTPIPLEFNPNQIADVVYVYAESDLPAPVAGVITLESKAYNVVGVVDVASRLKPPTGEACRIYSDNLGVGTLNYTGTASLFENTALDGGFMFVEQLTCHAPTGQIFDLDAATGGFVVVITCLFNDVPTIGTIANMSATIKFSNWQDFGQGVVFDNTTGVTFSENFVLNTRNEVGACHVEFSGTQLSIQVNDNFMATSGANEIAMRVDSASTTTAAVCVGNSFDVTLGGTIFDPTGKDQTDPEWKYEANSGVPNSQATGGMCILPGSPAQTVTISIVNTPVIISDTSTGGTNIWTLTDQERFSFDVSTGLATYTGKEDKSFQIITRATLTKTGGGTDEIALVVMINGTEDPCGGGSSDSSAPSSVTTISRATLSTGDTVASAVKNLNTTANVELSSVFLSIS